MSLQPLNGGVIVLVGFKASNLDEEIRTHPRVVIWDSQQQHWTDKELPANTRAVFCTKWISHNAFNYIMKQVRKRHLTLFRPEGTGQITKQVRELLHIEPKMVEVTKDNFVEVKSEQETIMANKGGKINKLKPLHQFIDPNKTNADNARFMLIKAQEMGITTTFGSLTNTIANHLHKSTAPKVSAKPKAEIDAVVAMMDSVIKELGDIRDYMVKMTDENRVLRNRLDRFKKFLEGE